MFKTLKEAVRQQFQYMIDGGRRLYRTNIDHNLLWDAYLNSFPEEVRQEYNCNACRSFIKHYGTMVTIDENNRVISLWQFASANTAVREIAGRLAAIMHEAKVIDILLSPEANAGVDFNHEKLEDGTITKWEHFHVKLPDYTVQYGDEIPTRVGKTRDSRNVLKRGMDEITLDAINTTIDLIAQNSIYRGQESLSALQSFLLLKIGYGNVPEDLKDNWAWRIVLDPTGARVSMMRNTAMGTLLTDISAGTDINDAVRKFEAIMAPANYKRPNAIITPRMIEQAEKTIDELGYARSLGRKFASVEDVNINNMLFVDRSLVKGGTLASLRETVTVSPKQFSRAEEIDVRAFKLNVLNRITKMEVLFENRHIPNLVSLIAPEDKGAPSLFKWDNGFSWSYKNAVTDSIKERVKSAGGSVTGELRISLAWHNGDDLDLHVITPSKDHISFRNKVVDGGVLDVDMNAGGPKNPNDPVENVTWARAVRGKYNVYVNQYERRSSINVGFTLEIEAQGQVHTFDYTSGQRSGENVDVVTFNYSQEKGIEIIKSIDANTKTTSKIEWGVGTNQFQPVSMVLHSPNYWNGTIGNEHLFFVIDKAHNDEQARGFFNEFLKPELETHKRVFEALGSRMTVAPADKQVSGLGFSTTKHDDVIVKVDGTSSRTLRIKF